MSCFSRAARATAAFLTILFSSLLTQAHAASPAGPLVLYEFSTGSGAVVRDLSGVGAPLDLRIADTVSTRWLPGGGLQVLKPTRIASSGAATKLSEAIKASNAMTIEAWIQPTSTGQGGPARVVTLSSNTKERNFTLGQESTAYDVRLRTTRNNDNGSKPSVTTPSGTLNTGLTHVVYTRDSNGSAAIYVNGVKQVSRTVSGELSNWDSAYRFGLANELNGDRPWLGTLHRVAIYNRVLGSSEIDRNFAAGARPESTTTSGTATSDPGSASPAGLLALYEFTTGSGAVVRDLSGVGAPLDLRIADTVSTRWLPGGGLQVLKPTRIASSGAATKLSEAIKASNAMTIEAWIQPTSTGQGGPARVVTLSSNTKERNFTLGQESTAYDVRLRTTRNNDNGSKPSVTTPSGTLNTGLTHVVYTRDSNGSAAIYVNGVKQVSRTVSGELSNWDSAYRFGLANELNGDRPWLGTLHRVAIYNRVLGGSEIDRNFAAGAQPESAATVSDSGADGSGATGGTDSSQPVSGTTVSEPVLVTGSAVLSWKPPATRSNGTPLSFAEIAGYVLYYGVAPGNYSSSISIDDAYTTSVTVADLPRGTYYFAVTARDTSGMESAYSKAATRVIE